MGQLKEEAQLFRMMWIVSVIVVLNLCHSVKGQNCALEADLSVNIFHQCCGEKANTLAGLSSAKECCYFMETLEGIFGVEAAGQACGGTTTTTPKPDDGLAACNRCNVCSTNARSKSRWCPGCNLTAQHLNFCKFLVTRPEHMIKHKYCCFDPGTCKRVRGSCKVCCAHHNICRRPIKG